MVLAIVACLAGVGLLAVAPDRFVAGAAALADRYGLSRIVIGAVIIGFGTSAPEMLVSGLAAVGGDADVGAGNVVGSNIANLSLILGVAGLMRTIRVPVGVLRRELPLTLAATIACALALQGGLSRIEGVLLAVGLVGALAYVVLAAGTGHPDEDVELAVEVEEYLLPEVAGGTSRMVRDLVLGMVGTLAGAQLLVEGATSIADEAGLSGGFVGMTLVALGTSLPELVTAVAAARRGEDQLIIGNLVGSNLFNSLAVSSVVGLAAAGSITDPALTVRGVGIMLLVTLAAAGCMYSRRRVARVESVALLAAYVVTIPLLAV